MSTTDRHTIKRLFLAVLFFLSSLSPLLAEDIVLIKSQDLPIYQDAQQGFQKIYANPIKVINLKGNPDIGEQMILPLKNQTGTVIVAMGLLAARMVKEYLPNQPMVFSMLFNPERFSLPGALSTGVTLHLDPLVLFEKIRRLFPEAKKIGVLFDPQKTARMIHQAKQAATRQGFILVASPVPTEQALPDVARKLLNDVDLLWVVPDSTVITPLSLEFLLLLTFEKKVPTVTFSKDLVKQGMVAALSPDYRAVGEETAGLALLMLAGKRELPIRSAPKMFLSINRTTARKIGIIWDATILKEADIVYE